MKIKKCVLCEIELTCDNDSKEHIIPHSIGGVRKVSGFICKRCNNKTGEEWDSELSKQLHFLGVLLQIKRERKEIPPYLIETLEGNKYYLNRDGSYALTKPVYNVREEGEKVTINIVGRDIKEAKKLLLGAKRKYPKLDESKFTETLKETAMPMREIIKSDLAFGGHSVGRSLIKSVLALCSDVGIEVSLCKKSLNFLKNENAFPCFGFYTNDGLVVNRPVGTIFHCVAVSGNPKTALLLGYVEFYSLHRVIICLSDDYVGEEFSHSYSIDPISGEELSLEIALDLSLSQLDDVYDYKMYNSDEMKKSLSELMELSYKNTFERDKNKAIEEAVKYAFENCGAKYGEELTGEQCLKLERLIREKMMPFYLKYSK